MIILGIDPGLKATGYGLIAIDQGRSKIIEAGTIEPKAKIKFEEKLETIYRNLNVLLDEYRPAVLVLEKLYAHHTYATTIGILGHVRGVICLACAQKRIELVEESVKRIRKILTGNGNASKLQTQRMILHSFSLKEKQLPLDASDALALALGYVQTIRFRP